MTDQIHNEQHDEPQQALSSALGSPRTVTIEHFLNKNRLQVELIPVDESDCNWRFPDGAELDYSWNVVEENMKVCDGCSEERTKDVHTTA